LIDTEGEGKEEEEEKKKKKKTKKEIYEPDLETIWRQKL